MRNLPVFWCYSSSLLSEQQKQLLLEPQQQLQQFLTSQNFTPVRTHNLDLSSHRKLYVLMQTLFSSLVNFTRLDMMTLDLHSTQGDKEECQRP